MSAASQHAQIDKYNRHSPEAKHLLQLCAVNHDGINRTDMVALSQEIGWCDGDGRKLDYKDVRSQIEAMVNEGLLVRTVGGSLTVQRFLIDFVVQDAIRSGDFERFAAKIQEKKKTTFSILSLLLWQRQGSLQARFAHCVLSQ
jgi:hypothetical protein